MMMRFLATIGVVATATSAASPISNLQKQDLQTTQDMLDAISDAHKDFLGGKRIQSKEELLQIVAASHRRRLRETPPEELEEQRKETKRKLQEAINVSRQTHRRKLQTAAEILEERWSMDHPVIAYDPDNQRFFIDFMAASDQNTEQGMDVEFYDWNCMDDHSGTYVQYIIPDGVFNPDDLVSRPIMTMDGQNGQGDPVPQLDFVAEPDILSEDPQVWTIVDPSMVRRNLQEGEGRREKGRGLQDWTMDDVGSGFLNMCSCSELGFIDGGGNFQAVNFIESLIEIQYQLNVEYGFEVGAFRVEPKEREETTVIQQYDVEAYLCNPAASVPRTNPNRMVPARITDYDVAGGTEAFNQGAMITVCVIPDDVAYETGIRLAGLTDFEWRRDVPLVTQDAIVGGTAASNMLTVYDAGSCSYAEFCTFSTILFADFYTSSGEVYGSGTAQLEFVRRRLEENAEIAPPEATAVFGSGRTLEEEEFDDTSAFNLAIEVNGADDEPGAMRTAGGPSLVSSARLGMGLMLLSATATLLP